MKTIHKFPITSMSRETVLDVPKGANFLAVQTQGQTVTLWAEVDTDQPYEKRCVFMIGTGHPLPDEPCEYIGTTQMLGGNLIWHFYAASKAEGE